MNTLTARLTNTLKRAFSQFLVLPLAVVVAFIALAMIFYRVDTAWSEGRSPNGFTWLGELLGDSSSLATLLSTVASSIITVTSITFSLLLIALQQGASALTAQVTDQFLMRRTNQFYFGYFVGLSIFVLISLVTASSIHRPVFGTTIALVLTAAALCMIVVMIYNTIDQMRPQFIVHTIRNHVLRARDNQLPLLRNSRRTPSPGYAVCATVVTEQSGHLVDIDADKLCADLGAADGIQIQLVVPLGRFLAYGEPLAAILSSGPVDPAVLDRLRTSVIGALSFDDSRNLKYDAAYGISQLSDIGWTSISTAKSNPSPGRTVVENLREILARWSVDGEPAGDPGSALIIADAAPGEAMDALELIILACSESIQAQTLSVALETVSVLLPVAPAPWATRLADVARRALSSLGEHVLTHQLEQALARLRDALEHRGFVAEAEMVRDATSSLSTTNGALNSRSTRVPSLA